MQVNPIVFVDERIRTFRGYQVERVLPLHSIAPRHCWRTAIKVCRSYVPHAAIAFRHCVRPSGRLSYAVKCRFPCAVRRKKVPHRKRRACPFENRARPQLNHRISQAASLHHRDLLIKISLLRIAHIQLPDGRCRILHPSRDNIP